MPKRSGIEACLAIKEAVPSAKIIMLTVSDEEADLYEAVKSGASGYLLKDSSIEEVAQAVRVVADGQSLISPSMAVKLIDEFKQMSRPEREHVPGLRLTERELEVLRLVAKGMNNREIASSCSSPRTPSRTTSATSSRSCSCTRAWRRSCTPSGRSSRPSVEAAAPARDSAPARRAGCASAATGRRCPCLAGMSRSAGARIALAAQGFLRPAAHHADDAHLRPHARAHRRPPGRLGQRAPAGALHAAVLPDGPLRRRPAARAASSDRAGWSSTGRTCRRSCRSSCGR